MKTEVQGILPLILLFGHTGPLSAQPPDCSASDSQCLQREFEVACREESASTQTCTEWLGELESLPDPQGSTARLIAAATYMALADLSQSEQPALNYRQEGIAVYRDLVARDSSNVQALLGLAAASDSRTERIDLLRRVVAVEPKHLIALQSLANELTQKGGKQETLEAADLLAQAYSFQTGPNKWYLASAALSAYRESGLTHRAIKFQQSVREDLGVDRMIEKLSASRDTQELARILAILCSDDVLSVTGECIKGINIVLDSSTSIDNRSKAQVGVDAAAAAMVSAADAEWLLMQQDANWRANFRTSIESLLSRGFESAQVYVAYARVLTGDKRLAALEKANALAPTDAQIALRLGLEYFERGMWREAVDQLKRAKNLLPDFQRSSVDQYLDRATSKLNDTPRT